MPFARLEAPKSAILTQIGSKEAMRIFFDRFMSVSIAFVLGRVEVGRVIRGKVLTGTKSRLWGAEREKSNPEWGVTGRLGRLEWYLDMGPSSRSVKESGTKSVGGLGVKPVVSSRDGRFPSHVEPPALPKSVW